jgi:alkanesulfonate monooxygenase SsuD/methylene tetrahydromethanopterin reductase-like flavin-dependent oxidoreductase (luciferase family)
VKIGLKLNTQFSQQDDPVQCTRELLDQVRAARDGGFDSVWVSQHWLAKPYQALQTWPMLGRVAAEAGEMQIGTSIFLLTLLNPVYAAESAATMDVITDGRFVFGLGLGYRPEEFEAFGVDIKQRGSRFEEALQVMLRLWSEDSVTHHGTHFQLTDAVLALKPVQRPHPPIWLAASGDVAVRRAARFGLPWLVNPHSSFDTVFQQMALYKEVAAASGHTVPDEVPVFKEISIAETRERAMVTAQPYVEGKYKSYSTWGLDKPMPESESLSVPFDELVKDRFIVGTPDDVNQEIKRYHDAIGANHFLMRFQWAGMPQERVLEQIAMMSKEVIPAWHSS